MQFARMGFLDLIKMLRNFYECRKVLEKHNFVVQQDDKWIKAVTEEKRINQSLNGKLTSSCKFSNGPCEDDGNKEMQT